MNEKQKTAIKNSVLILESAEQLKVETERINEGLAHEINCIVSEIMQSQNIARPSLIPEPVTRREKTRKLFKRKKGERPLKRKEMHKSLEEVELEINSVDPSKPPWVKKLYRKIMLKTHPDILSKDLSLEDKATFESYSRRAASAYKNNNHIDLIKIGAHINLYGDIDFPEQKKLLMDQYKNVQNGITNLHKSVSWVWGFLCNDIDDKTKYIKAICETKNIPNVEDKLIKKLIKKYSN